ncbi:MAG: hypothetical protein ACI4W6_07785 [Acutalibacteraceae bacterium]
MKTKLFELDLQLFAESGAAAGGEAAGQATGENTQAAAENSGDNVQDAAEERAKAYAKFKADYKSEFDAEVQGVVKERLKKAKDFEKEARTYKDKTSKILDALSVKYGVDAGNLDEIVKAVDADNSYYEDEAIARGIDVSELRHIKQIERENAAFKAAQAAESSRRAEEQWYRTLAQQANATKEIYPSFDMKTEAKSNPKFKELVEKGVDVKTAFEVTHHDETMAAAMNFAARETAGKIQNSISENKARPSENGLNQSGAVHTGIDINKLSRAQMAEYKERARRGEKIDLKS